MSSAPMLKTGSTLGICAPCARFDKTKFEQGLAVLNNMGFSTVTPDEIFLKQRYLAGEDTQRAEVLNRFFADDDIDGIMAVRGGYGSIRVIEHLNWSVIREHPKPVIGFSDCTALQTAIIEKTDGCVIHGPTVVSLSDADPQTVLSLQNVLLYPFSDLDIHYNKVVVPGKCTGVLKGGNLATLASMTGTPYMPDLTGAVLFIEDIGEPAYKIDRMLTQIKLSGALIGLAGLVTGSFENCENDHYIDEILMDVFSSYGIPIFSGLDCGHGKINLSLPLGHRISLSSDQPRIAWDD